MLYAYKCPTCQYVAISRDYHSVFIHAEPVRLSTKIIEGDNSDLLYPQSPRTHEMTYIGQVTEAQAANLTRRF